MEQKMITAVLLMLALTQVVPGLVRTVKEWVSAWKRRKKKKTTVTSSAVVEAMLKRFRFNVVIAGHSMGLNKVTFKNAHTVSLANGAVSEPVYDVELRRAVRRGATVWMADELRLSKDADGFYEVIVQVFSDVPYEPRVILTIRSKSMTPKWETLDAEKNDVWCERVVLHDAEVIRKDRVER